MKTASAFDGLSPQALALVLMAHVAVVAALLHMQTVAPAVPEAPLMVELFQDPITAPQAPKVSPPKPEPTPPKPKAAAQPNRPQPSVAPPVLAVESTQATPAAEVAKPEKASVQPVAVAATHSASATAQAPAAAAAPSAPLFDAAYLDNPAPTYPPLSRRVGEEGRVVLHVLVEASGHAAQVDVHSSSGYERLDRAAIAAVKRWKFVPAKQGAEAVAAWVLVPIVFSLKG